MVATLLPSGPSFNAHSNFLIRFNFSWKLYFFLQPKLCFTSVRLSFNYIWLVFEVVGDKVLILQILNMQSSFLYDKIYKGYAEEKLKRVIKKSIFFAFFAKNYRFLLCLNNFCSKKTFKSLIKWIDSFLQKKVLFSLHICIDPVE